MGGVLGSVIIFGRRNGWWWSCVIDMVNAHYNGLVFDFDLETVGTARSMGWRFIFFTCLFVMYFLHLWKYIVLEIQTVRRS